MEPRSSVVVKVTTVVAVIWLTNIANAENNARSSGEFDSPDHVLREGKGARRTSLDQLEGQPVGQDVWESLAEWTNGSSMTPDTTRNRVIVLVTWASWYSPSHDLLQEAQRWQVRYQRYGVQVVGVHHQTGWEDAASVCETLNVSIPLAHDKTGDFRKLLKLDADPDVCVVDRAGNLRYADIRPQSVEAAIESVLNETVSDAPAGPQTNTAHSKKQQSEIWVGHNASFNTPRRYLSTFRVEIPAEGDAHGSFLTNVRNLNLTNPRHWKLKSAPPLKSFQKTEYGLAFETGTINSHPDGDYGVGESPRIGSATLRARLHPESGTGVGILRSVSTWAGRTERVSDVFLLERSETAPEILPNGRTWLRESENTQLPVTDSHRSPTSTSFLPAGYEWLFEQSAVSSDTENSAGLIDLAQYANADWPRLHTYASTSGCKDVQGVPLFVDWDNGNWISGQGHSDPADPSRVQVLLLTQDPNPFGNLRTREIYSALETFADDVVVTTYLISPNVVTSPPVVPGSTTADRDVGRFRQLLRTIFHDPSNRLGKSLRYPSDRSKDPLALILSTDGTVRWQQVLNRNSRESFFAALLGVMTVDPVLLSRQGVSADEIPSIWKQPAKSTRNESAVASFFRPGFYISGTVAAKRGGYYQVKLFVESNDGEKIAGHINYDVHVNQRNGKSGIGARTRFRGTLDPATNSVTIEHTEILQQTNRQGFKIELPANWQAKCDGKTLKDTSGRGRFQFP